MGAQSLQKPRKSISHKLVALVVFSIGVAMIIVTSLALWQEGEQYLKSRSEALLGIAAVFAAAAGPATAENDAATASDALRAISRIPGVLHAHIEKPDRSILVSVGFATQLDSDVRFDARTSVSLWDMFRSRSLQVTVPVIDGGLTVGTLSIVGDTAGLRENLLATLHLTGLGSVLALLAGLAVAYRLQQNISSPLRDLTQAMLRIRGSHDYSTRVSVVSDDEVGTLVTGFNAMLTEINERDHRLEEHRAGLEQEVVARTTDYREARDAAESANRAKSDFLATMSHEIRTPMNGIMVMAEMLTASDLAGRQRRFAEVIAKSGQSLLAIINDILDLSKIEAGKLELESVPVDLNELAENVTCLFSERAAAKGLDLIAYVDPALPRVVAGDPVRLGQIINNLVNNALKFTQHGSVKLTLEPTMVDEAHCLAISVADSGIGIPQEKLASIFDAFSQADQSTTRQFGGTGLGLTISRKLVTAMGGHIQVRSEAGAGSTFTVTTPLRALEHRPWPRVVDASGKPAICLIDLSSAESSAVLKQYFEAAGYCVIRASAPSPDECLQASVIWVDPDRVPACAGEGASPLVIALCPMSNPDSAALLDSSRVHAVITHPLLRSEIEDVLRRIAAGERSFRPVASSGNAAPVLGLSPFKALVADDSVVNREVATEALRLLGGAVETVENGREAVRAVRACEYDVVLMDGSMPEMDGFEAARVIRREEAESNRRRVPIVALTAHVVGAGAEAWREAGMDAVVHKPFTINQLADTIAKVCPTLIRTERTEPAENHTAERPVPETHNEPETPGGDAPLLDPLVLDQIAQIAIAGQADFEDRIFNLYIEHAPAALATLEDAAAGGSPEECAKAAHALKSMSFNVGAARVAALAGSIEANARQQLVLTSDVLAALQRTLQETLVSIGSRNAPPSVTQPTPVQPKQGGEDDLRRAMDRGEMSLVYQPLVDRQGERTIGVEALLRWQRPDGAVVMPSDFVPLAEQSGLIHELGSWALEQACRDACHWPAIAVAVNVSPIQFEKRDFAERCEDIVRRTGLAWSRLELELTESALLTAEDAVLQAMQRLIAQGATFALDDFGTGYSSLTYLRRFPFGKVKIDRSFTENVDSAVEATIVHAVTSIGRSLGLKIVAEGVQTIAQQRFMAAAGAHALQGYLFGEPMSKVDIARRLEAEAQAPARRSAAS